MKPQLLTPGQGFAESYMLGEVSSPDLTKFFEVRARNSQKTKKPTTPN